MSDTPKLSNIPEDTLPCPAAASPPVPDRFFNLTLVSFQVENTVFRVPKHGFDIPGTIFEAMFTLPSPENGEGSSNDNPIYLSGIKEDHFRSFLQVIYPFREQPSVTKFDDWMGVLSISTLWEFTQIRNEAIAAVSSQINQKNVLQRIQLGRKYNVTDWIRNAYVELVQKDTLKIEELSETSSPLDWPTIAKIFYMRDYSPQTATNYSTRHGCGNNHGGASCPYGYPIRYNVLKQTPNAAREIVDEIFRKEFSEHEKGA
ncbi:hypothetical protein CVT25_003461 [Psilocybe cyanescens]|uniref:BTB domain-containing protein n=1 Tax=Psilocybe cyanescens TaxID=93625 RepID=A0A409X541_PSICY|nr:hypothetical protein CVT25_003461 [Psilocybe cyanescens]